MSTDGSESAMPAYAKGFELCEYTGMEMPGDVVKGGLTKREYFAALAMQGICARGMYERPSFEDASILLIANSAVSLSNALIAELNKESEK